MLSSPNSKLVAKFLYDPREQIWWRRRKPPDKRYKFAMPVEVVTNCDTVLINEIDEWEKLHSTEIENWCKDNLLGTTSVTHVSTNIRGLRMEQYFLICFELEEDATLVYLAYKG